MAEISPQECELQRRQERERAHRLSETVEQRKERLRKQRDRDRAKTLLSIRLQSQGRPR